MPCFSNHRREINSSSQRRIDTLLVHLSKRQSAMFQEEVARMLCVVQVVGVVDNTLDVALVVAHLHTGFINVFTHIFSYFLTSLQIFITNATTQAFPLVTVFFHATTQAFPLVTVFFLQLDKCLRVTSTLHVQSALFPHADNVVVLSLQLLQNVESTIAQRLLHAVPSVCKEHGHTGVDHQQINGERRQVLGIAETLRAKGVVRLPIWGYLRAQHLSH